MSGNITVSVTHEVKDFAAWKPAFDDGEALRKANKLTTENVVRDLSNSNVVRIIFSTPADNVSAVQALMASPQLQEVMKAAGVISVPVIQYWQ